MALVSAVPTGSYEPEALSTAVARHFEALGLEKDLRPGLRVLIKPNLLAARRPEQAVATRWELVAAVAEWLRGRGVSDITLADSPAGPYTAAALKTVYSVSGMKRLEGLVKLNYDTAWREVKCCEGCMCRSLNIIAPVLDAELVINMPKLKTHSMMTMSAGVKNLFGCIPGLQKPELHYKYPEAERFARMLCDIAQTVRPAVTLIDAVEAMEGNGPSGGDPRLLGLTLASRDVWALDYAAAGVMGLKPLAVETIKVSSDLQLLHGESIDIIGDLPVNEKPFKLPEARGLDFLGYLPGPLRGPAGKMLRKLLTPVPKLEEQKCVGCGKCAESCPVHIIRLEGGKAHFESRGCISCFCCQEMCPAKAIRVKRIFK